MFFCNLTEKEQFWAIIIICIIVYFIGVIAGIIAEKIINEAKRVKKKWMK